MKWSCLQLEFEGTDCYARTLAYLWVTEPVEGWILFNEELAAQGFARYNDYGEKHQYSNQVEQAAATAQSQGLGSGARAPKNNNCQLETINIGLMSGVITSPLIQ